MTYKTDQIALDAFDWEGIYYALMESCAVSGAPDSVTDFVNSMLDGFREYRFGGALGFGGKLHHGFNRIWVSCYSEDMTAERRLRVRQAHVKFHQMLGDRVSVPET